MSNYSINNEVDNIVDNAEAELPEFCIQIIRTETYYIITDSAKQAVALALTGEQGPHEEQMTIEVHEDIVE